MLFFENYKMMHLKNDENFIAETQSYWADYYQREISEDEACEIVQNVYEFYSVLRECKRRKLAREAGDAS